MLDRADYILYMLATVLLLWGASLLWRGIRQGKILPQRRCPECRRDIAGDGMKCTACGYESDRGRDFRVRTVHRGLVAAGVGLLPLGIGVWFVATVVAEWGYRSGHVPDISPGWSAAGFACAVVGLITVLRGFVGKRTGGKRHCPKCWYSMNDLAGTRCPECGHDAWQVSKLYRRRRSRTAVVVGVLLLAAGPTLWLVPRQMKRGWIGLVPTTALITWLEFGPDPMTRYGTGMLMALAGELSTREYARETWGWQLQWQSNACRRILSSSTDAARLNAAAVLSWMDNEMYDLAIARAFNALSSNDPREFDSSLSIVAYFVGNAMMAEIPMNTQWDEHSVAETDRVFSLLSTTTRPGPARGLAVLLALRSEPDRQLIERLVKSEVALPPGPNSPYQEALRRIVSYRPRSAGFLEELLENGSAAERLVCVSAVADLAGPSVRALFTEAPESGGGYARALRKLAITVESVSRTLGVTREFDRSSGGRLWASASVREQLWNDIVTPRLAWIETALAGTDSEAKSAACDAVRIIAQSTPISCNRFRIALERCAAEGIAHAPEALRELERAKE